MAGQKKAGEEEPPLPRLGRLRGPTVMSQTALDLSPPESKTFSIRVMFPVLSVLLLVLSLGITIVLSTLSHLRTVETLVRELQLEVGSRIAFDITGYFNGAEDKVGDLRALAQSGVMPIAMPELNVTGDEAGSPNGSGNGPFAPYTARPTRRT
jgi:hypothetical protein